MATITSSALLACSKAGLHCVSNSSKIYRFPTEEKFIMNLSNVCSLNTLFILVCTILTLLLICQELFTFTIVKPTTSSHEERELEIADLPDVVFCLDPAFDSVNLTRFGYRRDSYFRGSQSRHDKDFVGWNEQGEENATKILREKQKEKSSQDILIKVLVFDNELLNQLVKEAYYVRHKDGLVYVKPEMKFRILAYPYGRCLVLSPPTEHISKMKLGALYLEVQTNGLGLRERKTKVKIFFMERSSSLLLYPDEMEMTGVKPEVKFWGENNYEIITYKVKISRAHHVQGDPLYDCAPYTIDNSFNDCVQNEVLEFFDKEINCQPPLLAKEPSLMCNRKFNVSSTKAEKITDYFWRLYVHNMKFKCRTPCSTTNFTTQLVHTTKSDDFTTLVIVFDSKVDIVHSSFKIDEQTFVTRLGGSVSSGRTLLWILLGLLGTFEVNQSENSFMVYIIIINNVGLGNMMNPQSQRWSYHYVRVYFTRVLQKKAQRLALFYSWF